MRSSGEAAAHVDDLHVVPERLAQLEEVPGNYRTLLPRSDLQLQHSAHHRRTDYSILTSGLHGDIQIDEK